MLYKLVYQADTGKKYYSSTLSSSNADVCLHMHTQLKAFEKNGIHIISSHFAIYPEYDIFERLVQKGLSKIAIRKKMKISEYKYDELMRYYRGFDSTRLTYSKYLREKEKGLVDYQIMYKYGIPIDEFEKFLLKHRQN